ncbi:YgaP family membrane protein [Bacillus suaedaesalsae]|uniref:DUF2892 domain-containing protein n=1 Tax=Bacillus suaedaesalsae TaxID=2810349 RepID=A0ABS2DCQ5_9BACI|nr:DUF2892 domain-containing protein [Bacillus suaedaesalsae]MBM6616246.1 DUF2892 domain-containing protein [Bacillus suaedaesalsae]
MKPNIGIINALIRITCGFTLLAIATAKLSRRNPQESYLLVAILAAMKIGEGIVRFCPLTYLYNEYKEDDEQRKEHDTAINPT